MAQQFSTIQDILIASYSSISGESASARDWQLHESLFLPDARLVIIINDGGGKKVEFKSREEYMNFFTSFVGDKPFFEIETHHSIEVMDSFALVWSDYETRTAPDGPVLYTGTNCLQLFNDGRRWWIISILWERKVKAL